MEEDKPIFLCETAKLQHFQDTCCPPVFALGSVLKHRNMTEGSWRHQDILPMQEGKIKASVWKDGVGGGQKWIFIFSKLYRKDM